MGDPVFEDSITEEILRICNRLDVGNPSTSDRKALLERLEKLIKIRDKIRKAFKNEEKPDSAHNQ